MYIYIYNSDQITWEKQTKKQKTKEKKCVIYFMHVYTSKKTF